MDLFGILDYLNGSRVATLLKLKPWKAVMDWGRVPREGIFTIFMLIVGLLLACGSIANNIYNMYNLHSQ